MKMVGFGKGQGFADTSSQALAQGIEPTLDTVGLTAVFADRLMTVSGKDALIRIPEIAERVATGVGVWNAPPELQATGFGAVTDEEGKCAMAEVKVWYDREADYLEIVFEDAPASLEEVREDVFERRTPDGCVVGLAVFNVSKHDRDKLMLPLVVTAVSAA